MCKSGKNGFWKTSIQLKNNQKLKIPHTIRNLDFICISNLISPGIDISSKNFFLDDLSIPKSHKEPITISTKSQYVEIDELDAKFCNKFLFNFKNTYELCINAFNTAKHLCFNNKFIIGNSLKSLRIKNRILHPEYLVLNENLESLYIQELKSCKNLKLNSNLKKLEIYYLKTAYGLILNDNLEKLILPNTALYFLLTFCYLLSSKLFSHHKFIEPKNLNGGSPYDAALINLK